MGVKYVFGPVPSRRLGKSLGIDPVPLKTCNWNCVYCQLGRTRPLTNERREYFLRQEILDEVREALTLRRPGEIDWVTFVGSGEPTLHCGLGWLIRRVKELTDLPIAVITNGSLLYDLQVREELLAADAVLPTLDAGNSVIYRQINRPWPKLTFDRHLRGLQTFRQDYPHKFWIEIMLLKGVNDTEEALVEIEQILHTIEPNQVHLTLPVRPPAETWVRPSDENGLQRAMDILGEAFRVIHPTAGSFRGGPDKDLESAILGVITRHPMQIEELLVVLNHWEQAEVQHAISKLQNDLKVKVVVRYGQHFLSASEGYFAD